MNKILEDYSEGLTWIPGSYGMLHKVLLLVCMASTFPH
jgi:hypothetical protein